jgi:hypothetical protein
MRVSEQQLKKMQADLDKGITYYSQWPSRADLVPDLIEARARIAELEQSNASAMSLLESVNASAKRRGERIAELEQTLCSQTAAKDLYYEKIQQNKDAAQRHIAELEAQLAEARQDGERMDWLERCKKFVSWHKVAWLGQENCVPQLVNAKPGETWPGGIRLHATLRAAIDAAKAEGEKTK